MVRLHAADGAVLLTLGRDRDGRVVRQC